jgi:hypothetical protein
VDALLKGHIDIAWNGPLAHVRVQKLTNNSSVSLGMRDVDRDFTSHIIATKESGVTSVKDLAGKKLAVGTVDSPQAYSCILPLHHIATAYHYISIVLVLLHSWHPHTTIYLASLYSYIFIQLYMRPHTAGIHTAAVPHCHVIPLPI